jgi:hypothetical protein
MHQSVPIPKTILSGQITVQADSVYIREDLYEEGSVPAEKPDYSFLYSPEFHKKAVDHCIKKGLSSLQIYHRDRIYRVDFSITLALDGGETRRYEQGFDGTTCNGVPIML